MIYEDLSSIGKTSSILGRTKVKKPSSISSEQGSVDEDFTDLTSDEKKINPYKESVKLFSNENCVEK